MPKRRALPESDPQPVVPAHDLDHVNRLCERFDWGHAIRPLPAPVDNCSLRLVNGVLAIASLAILTAATNVPFVFLSLEPTTYLLFFSPRGRGIQPAQYRARARHRIRKRLRSFWLMGMSVADAGFD
jgi:hypothetical protein